MRICHRAKVVIKGLIVEQASLEGNAFRDSKPVKLISEWYELVVPVTPKDQTS